MQLTLFTDYGLRSLMFLAVQPEHLCSVREIAEHYQISRNHLVKVVHRLAQLGYVDTVKGKGGGIRLARDPRELRLGELVRRMEPNMHLVECFDPDRNQCRITEVCRLKHVLFSANTAFFDALDQHTLADIVQNREPLLAALREG
jgi:Rrf2 family nitric oxide-sensitive transcriptional repressor